MAIQEKTLFKMEMIARYRAVHPNCTYQEMADLFGMTPGAVANLMAKPEYRTVVAKFATNVLGIVDEEMIDKDLIVRRYKARLQNEALPVALDFLIQAARGRVNNIPVSDTVQFNAARDLLDREGSFPKLSRTNMQVETKEAIGSADDDVANDIVNKMKTAQQQGQKTNTSKFIN
jgi:hypothetical protein